MDRAALGTSRDMDQDTGMDALIERARRGDKIALEELLVQVAPSIHRFGLRMCKNAHDADDVLQDTLLSVARHLGEFEGRSSLTSWVFALTRSACTRRRRGLKNQEHVPAEQAPEPVDPEANPETTASDRELADLLSRALDELPEAHREVILLRDVEGLSAPEAAATLGVTVDALKSRLHRAREALRVALRPHLEPAQAAPAQCPDVVAMWSQKLEGDLRQEDCATMEKHVLTCPHCSAACDALKRALLACRRVAGEEVPPVVQARVKEAVRAWADQVKLSS